AQNPNPMESSMSHLKPTALSNLPSQPLDEGGLDSAPTLTPTTVALPEYRKRKRRVGRSTCPSLTPRSVVLIFSGNRRRAPLTQLAMQADDGAKGTGLILDREN